MESFPKRGMTYKQSLKKAQRHLKEGSITTVNSIVNQVRIHEGEKGAKEFSKEVAAKERERGGKKYF